MLHNILRAYVYSNIHIACAAVGLVWGGMCFWAVKIDFALLLIVFLSTFVSYNIHRIIGYHKGKPYHTAARYVFFGQYQKLIYALLVLSALGIIYLFTLLPWPVRGFMIGQGLITSLYILPVLPSGVRLRDAPYVKIFLISLIWASLFFMPLAYGSTDQPAPISIILLAIEKVLFLFVLTLPFDYRDLIIERALQVPTLAEKWAPHRAIHITAVACMGASIIHWILYFSAAYTLAFVLMGMVFYGVLFCLLEYAYRKTASEFYYLFVLDGMLLVHGMLYIALRS